MPDLPGLASFCKQSRNVMVRYQFENFVPDNPNSLVLFLTAGIALTYAVKGNEAGIEAQRSLVGSRISMGSLIQEAQHWRETWGIQYHLRGISNFSFWPVTADSGKDVFGYRFVEHFGIARGSNNTRIAVLRRYARMWFDNGISGCE